MSLFSQTFFGKRAKKKFSGARGFTLIELLLVTIIMVIMTTLILIQQQKFDSATLLRSLGYSVALSIRQAQTYGVSVRESSPGSGTFASGYGVYFSSVSPNTYILFADANGNGQYDSGEAVQTFIVNSGYVISDFCVQNNSANVACWVAGGGGLTSLTVLFKHPNPDAKIIDNNGTAYGGAYIQIKATGSGATRSVTVSSTGQIVVGTLNS
jgi:prepilin-type N-terminal cleavage/methylation domain-containing protein